MSAWWDASIYATCLDCGRDFEGSQRTIAAALKTHRKHEVMWVALCGCGQHRVTGTSAADVRRKMKEHLAQRFYEPVALFEVGSG